jgi:hypothetical protein
LAVSTEILRTWRAPRQVVRRLLDAGQREDRALAWLMAGCFLVFVGQWPRLSREVALAPDGPPLDARVMGAFFGWVVVAPLLFYGLAAASHMVARLLGGRGTWFGARLALFWTLLAVSPLILLHGLVAGFMGPGPEMTITGAALALAFVGLWVVSLTEAERSHAG